MLKYNSDKKKLYEYAKENREEIRGMDEGERRGIIKGEKRGEIKGERKGEIRGKSEGESRMAALVAALLEDNRIDLLAAAVKNKLLRRKLFEQYKI